MARRATKAERDYMQEVASMGCFICKMPAEIHHITTGIGMGQRASNFDVIPLCPSHHRHGKDAIHSGKGTWEAKYGSELDMCRQVQRMAGLDSE